MFLLDALRERDSGCLLLYNAVAEPILFYDMSALPLDKALHRVLRENGFENIVFYDGQSGRGKYVCDDISAWYSIAGARQIYEKKYVGPPCNAPGAEKKQNAAIRTFGITAAGAVCRAGDAEMDMDGDTVDPIPWEQGEQDPSLFYDELCDWILEPGVKTACVMELSDFLRMCDTINMAVRPWEKANGANGLLLLTTPHGIELLQDWDTVSLLYSSGIYHYLFRDNESGGSTFVSEHCVPVLPSQSDEFWVMLQILKEKFHAEYSNPT